MPSIRRGCGRNAGGQRNAIGENAFVAHRDQAGRSRLPATTDVGPPVVGPLSYSAPRKNVVAIRAPAASPTAAEPPVYQSRANTPNSPGSTLSHSGRPVPRSRRIALALPAPVAERLGEPSAPHPSRLLSFRSHLPRPYRLIPLPSLGKPAVRRARLEARAGGTTAP